MFKCAYLITASPVLLLAWWCLERYRGDGVAGAVALVIGGVAVVAFLLCAVLAHDAAAKVAFENESYLDVFHESLIELRDRFMPFMSAR